MRGALVLSKHRMERGGNHTRGDIGYLHHAAVRGRWGLGASIHELPRRVLLGNLYSPGGRSLVRNSATRAGEACRTPLVVASVLLRSLGLEICESSFGDLYPSARHHIPGRLAFQVSVVPQSKHNFTVQVAIALVPDRIYSKVLRDVV